jgi:hypothetical protein
MSTLDRLLERLQTRWQPTPDEIDAGVPQHRLRDWEFWKATDHLIGYPDDEAGWREVDVLWIDPHLAWALCTCAFYWLD